MAATGSINDTAKRLMLEKTFIIGDSNYEPVKRILVTGTKAGGGTFTSDLTTTLPIFAWNDKLVLNAGQAPYTVPIGEAATIDEILLQAEDLNLSSPGSPVYVTFATISLGADSVTFQGPGNYTITQLDIDLA